MTFASSVQEVATSTECAHEAALLNEDESCEEHCEVQCKQPMQTTLKQQTVIIAAAASICMVCIFGLVASAFNVDPCLESCIDPDVTVASETSMTLVAFVMGWAMCFVAKKHKEMAGTVGKLICAAPQLSAAICSATHSVVSAATGRYHSLREWFSSHGKVLVMTMVGAMCTGCIVVLFVSAFTAVPDDEAPTDDGFASESSQTMKAFTVGWMFLLSFKLRSELVGLVGSSCALQPF